MKIKSISFLNGWQGSSSIRIKAVIEEPETDDMSEVILEKAEAERVLVERLNAGSRLTLEPGQKLYRIVAE